MTLGLKQTSSGTKMTLHVELPANLPEDGEPGWWPLVRGGWSDTVDRLAADFNQARAQA